MALGDRSKVSSGAKKKACFLLIKKIQDVFLKHNPLHMQVSSDPL